MIFSDQRQREIDPRSYPGRRHERPVAKVNPVGLDPRFGKGRREMGGILPVRGRDPPVQQPRPADREGAGADRSVTIGLGRPVA
jgi:hypothetical protein